MLDALENLTKSSEYRVAMVTFPVLEGDPVLARAPELLLDLVSRTLDEFLKPEDAAKVFEALTI